MSTASRANARAHVLVSLRALRPSQVLGHEDLEWLTKIAGWNASDVAFYDAHFAAPDGDDSQIWWHSRPTDWSEFCQIQRDAEASGRTPTSIALGRRGVTGYRDALRQEAALDSVGWGRESATNLRRPLLGKLNGVAALMEAERHETALQWMRAGGVAPVPGVLYPSLSSGEGDLNPVR